MFDTNCKEIHKENGKFLNTWQDGAVREKKRQPLFQAILENCENHRKTLENHSQTSTC
jgi:hypothetical protein